MIFKEHPDFLGYWVSDCGTAFGPTGKFLTPGLNSSGRYTLDFQTCSRRQRVLRARAVAMVHVPGYEEGLTVNHIDGDKTNDHASNLEWVSNAENLRHHARLQCGYDEIDVMHMRIFHHRGWTVEQVAQELEITVSTARDILTGRSWKWAFGPLGLKRKKRKPRVRKRGPHKLANYKLTAEQVVELRERYASNKFTQAELAEHYGIHVSEVSLIVRGLRCTDVGGPLTFRGQGRWRLKP